jgi:hypothetical protein
LYHNTNFFNNPVHHRLLFIPSFYSTLHFTSKMPAVTDSQTRGRLAGKNAIITGAAG